MDDTARFDKKQAIELFQILRERLGQSSEGSQLITAFQNDPEQGSASLADYLHHRLPEDTALAEQLAQAMGTDEGSQFTTLVTGGQVDQIVNIARLGVLNLTLERYFFIFRSVRQVVVFLLIVLLALATVAYGVWLSSRPRRLKGDLNVAVAELREISDMSHALVARTLSQNLFSSLDEELAKSNIDADTTHDKIGVITEVAQARDLAESIDADLVIYGTVSVLGEHARLSPRFFVGGTLADASELTGEHKLAVPIEFLVSEVLSPQSDVNNLLRQRTRVLIELVKALGYYNNHEYTLAHEAIRESIRLSDEYGDFEGKETLYLVAANIAGSLGDMDASQVYVDEAIRLNPKYARAYLAQANIHYLQQDFEEAIRFYQLAQGAEDRTDIAYIDEKANYGLGSVYTYLYQTADEQDKENLGQKALLHFDAVIASYETGGDENLSELAALAYYGSGVVYQGRSQMPAAEANYRKAYDLTESLGLKERIENRINALGGQ